MTTRPAGDEDVSDSQYVAEMASFIDDGGHTPGGLPAGPPPRIFGATPSPLGQFGRYLQQARGRRREVADTPGAHEGTQDEYDLEDSFLVDSDEGKGWRRLGRGICGCTLRRRSVAVPYVLATQLPPCLGGAVQRWRKKPATPASTDEGCHKCLKCSVIGWDDGLHHRPWGPPPWDKCRAERAQRASCPE